MPRNLIGSKIQLLGLLVIACAVANCGGNTNNSKIAPLQRYQSLTIAPASATVRQGATVGMSGLGNRFVAVGRYADGSADYSWIPTTAVASASWNSSVPAVATIDAQGHFETLSSGTTTISATLGSLRASTTLVVSATAPILTAVEMTPGLPQIGNDGKITGIQYQAIAKYDDGSERDITREGIWISSDITAATIDSSGLLTYKSERSCDVVFLYGLSYNRFTLHRN